jgi:hypothetical protein
MGIPLRFILHSGIISDLEWLSSMGFDEAGPVCNIEDVPMTATAIHRAGIRYAAVNPFADVSAAPGEAGAPLAPAFQALKSAHWDIVAGAGMSADIVRVAMNYMHFCSYGSGESSGETSVYSAPWNHPVVGPNTLHVDYIDTFKSSRWYQSCIDMMAAAVAAGNCGEIGIMIPLWVGSILESSLWINVINAARAQGVPCSNVCFWADQVTDGTEILKTDASETLNGLIKYYGVRQGIQGE